MNTGTELARRYNEICAGAQGPEHTVPLYEELYRQAEKLGDRPLMARCLSDMAALIGVHDAETSQSLLETAANLAPQDARILENLGLLQRQRDPVRACQLLLQAAQCSERERAWERVAVCLDAVRPLLDRAPGMEGEFEAGLGRLMKAVAQPSQGQEGATRVLLLADPAINRSALEDRIQVCLLRGEQPVVLSPSTDRPDLPESCEVILGQPESDGSWLEEMVTLVSRNQYLRAEVISERDAVQWAYLALAAGCPVHGHDELFKPVEITDLLPIPAAEVAPGTTSVDISVVIPAKDRPDLLANALRALQQQTLARDRFEIIVVDDGSAVPLQSALPSDVTSGVTFLRNESSCGPASARNRGIDAVRSELVLFLNDDAVPAFDAVEQHLTIHGQHSYPLAVLGRFDNTENCRDVLNDMLERGGLVFPYFMIHPRIPLGPQFFWTCNLSVPVAAVREVGGFDESFRRPMCEDAELGVRLGKIGIFPQHFPTIGCGHDHPMDLPRLIRRSQWLGHEWVRAARKHGEDQPILFNKVVLPDANLGQRALETVLEAEDKSVRFLETVEQATEDLDQFFMTRQDLRNDALEKVQADFLTLLHRIMWQEVARGVVGAIQGFDPDQWEESRREIESRAAVFVMHDEAGKQFVEEILASLPQNVELIVGVSAGAVAMKLPTDPRVCRVLLPSGESAEAGREWVVQATQAGALVFLDGTTVPRSMDWDSLFRLLGSAPTVGAVGLGESSGKAAARGELAELIPASVVATRRRFVDQDESGPGSFLERMKAKGRHLVCLRPADTGAIDDCPVKEIKLEATGLA